MDIIDLTGPNEVLEHGTTYSGETINLGQSGPEETQAKLSSGRKWWAIVIGLNDENGDLIEMGQVRQVFEDIASKWAFQQELSDDGYNHYQCLVQLYKKQRKQTMLRKLSVMLKCVVTNISIKPSDQDFIKYVTKEETRVDGPWSKGFANVQTRPPRLIKRVDFYPWQAKVAEIIESEPDDRSIYWIWDPVGNCGKTAFCKWLVYHFNAFIFRGKSSDMASRIVQMSDEVKIAIMNVSRSQEQFVSYQCIEEIKDGLVCSGKYEGGQKIFDCPHVFIFANFEPDYNALSMDRWKVWCINELDLTGNIDYNFVPNFDLVENLIGM